MKNKIIKRLLCIILALLQFGCSSTYRLNIHTQPSGAIVEAGSKVYGTTPCVVEIPKNSSLIKDKHHIDITYLFPDGQSLNKNYDLRLYEPPSKFPGFIRGIFIVPGVLLLSLTQTNEDDQYTSFDKEDDNRTDLQWQLIGVGLVGIGVLAYYILGGSEKGSEGFDILETQQNL
jgi:hypothetical protein